MAYPMKKTRHAKILCLDDDHTNLEPTRLITLIRKGNKTLQCDLMISNLFIYIWAEEQGIKKDFKCLFDEF